jgi:hypothetical protein
LINAFAVFCVLFVFVLCFVYPILPVSHVDLSIRDCLPCLKCGTIYIDCKPTLYFLDCDWFSWVHAVHGYWQWKVKTLKACLRFSWRCFELWNKMNPLLCFICLRTVFCVPNTTSVSCGFVHSWLPRRFSLTFICSKGAKVRRQHTLYFNFVSNIFCLMFLFNIEGYGEFFSGITPLLSWLRLVQLSSCSSWLLTVKGKNSESLLTFWSMPLLCSVFYLSSYCVLCTQYYQCLMWICPFVKWNCLYLRSETTAQVFPFVSKKWIVYMSYPKRWFLWF